MKNMARVMITNVGGDYNIPYDKIRSLSYNLDANPNLIFIDGTTINDAHGTPGQIIALLNTGVTCRNAHISIATPEEAIILDEYENTRIYIHRLTGQCNLVRVFGFIWGLPSMQLLCESCANLKITRIHLEHFQQSIAGREYNVIMVEDPNVINALGVCVVRKLIVLRVDQNIMAALRNVNIPEIQLSYHSGNYSIDPILENPNVRSLQMSNQPIITTDQCHLLEFVCRYQNDFIDQRIAENMVAQID